MNFMHLYQFSPKDVATAWTIATGMSMFMASRIRRYARSPGLSIQGWASFLYPMSWFGLLSIFILQLMRYQDGQYALLYFLGTAAGLSMIFHWLVPGYSVTPKNLPRHLVLFFGNFMLVPTVIFAALGFSFGTGSIAATRPERRRPLWY